MNRQSDRTIIPVRHVIRRRLAALFSALLIPAALTMSCSTNGDLNNEVNGAGTARVTGSRPVVVASMQPTAPHSPSAPSSTRTETYEVTPEGLTTAVNVPLEISEAELTQSCIDVRPTLTTFGGDVDAVLAMIQATAVGSWKNATPQEQAAIIAALRAAADGDC
ncbi:MAG: lipoprotein LpqV [Rhodococcus sp. (in: high G+C Gram-positive bacteria)]|uniref:lipoprotein LpqV n=1 Tax=Rhodococcus sp. TaxID=1831 RepID=UPI002ADA932B|nr:lipoprotein LpqV [Rhodococcus sp. (in: high G+C Gram-positive bacteria)]